MGVHHHPSRPLAQLKVVMMPVGTAKVVSWTGVYCRQICWAFWMPAPVVPVDTLQCSALLHFSPCCLVMMSC